MNPHIDLNPKVIPPKRSVDIVPSSSADITRALRGCSRGESVSHILVEIFLTVMTTETI